MASFGHKFPLKGADEHWGITRSQDVHLRIATYYAIGAIGCIIPNDDVINSATIVIIVNVLVILS